MNVEGHYEWVPEFLCRGGAKFTQTYLCCHFSVSCGLHRQPPTPTGAASGHADWIRLTAPPTAKMGQCHQPLLPVRTYARDVELPRCTVQHRGLLIKTLSKGLYAFLYLTWVSPARAVRGALLRVLWDPGRAYERRAMMSAPAAGN